MIDPERWAILSRAIRDDRNRQSLTREQLVARIRQQGGDVTTRSIGTLEEGPAPKRRKRPTLEPTVRALGWLPGWTDRILAGEDPAAVLRRDSPVEVEHVLGVSPRGQILELAQRVYEFSRTAARLGAPPALRDEFDELTQRLIDAVPATQVSPEDVDLAADRPHAEGEGVPADDAERIRNALGVKT